MLRKKEQKRNKLKIAFITEYFPSTDDIDVRGGVELRTFLLARELVKHHEVYVISSREGNKPINQILLGIKVKRIGFSRKYTQGGSFLNRLSFIHSNIHQLNNIKPDLIEGSGIIGQLASYIYGKNHNVVKVAFVPDTFSNFADYFGLFSNFILKSIEKLIFNNSWDAFIVISNTVRNKLLKFNIEPKKIHTIYCAVDIEQTGKISSTKSKHPSICVISRLVEYKQVDKVIQAVKKMHEDGLEAKCNIVGDGPLRGSLSEMVMNLKLQNNILFHGSVEKHKDVLKILKSSWVYVSASKVEGFGISAIEAMALGVPFVISDIDVYREITSSKGGLFFNPDDIDDLAKKIKKLVLDKNLRNKIAEGKRKVITNYSLTKMVKATENLYLKLVNN